MLSIPIISEFDSKGVKKAIKEFKQLETNGQRAAFVLKKAGQAAAVGFAALGAAAVGAGVALWNFAKMAMDDQKSQKQLAASIKAVTKATDAQIKATEEWITKTQLALGVSDTDLRAGLARLVRSTKNVHRAQTILNLALDISASTGKNLETVVNALGRAYDGKRLKTVRLKDAEDEHGKKIKRTGQIMVENLTPLAKLGLGFSKAELSTLKFNDALEILQKKYGGEAQAAAGTFEGRWRRLTERFGELKESLGTGVLPYLSKLIDYGIRLSDVMGEQGLAGAVNMLVQSLKQLAFYDKSGNLNTLGKSIQLAGKAFNFLSRTAGVIGGAAVAVANPGKGAQIINESLHGSKGTINTLNPYSDPFAARSIGGGLPQVTINVNGAVDPVSTARQIQKLLDQYGRRIGRATP